jgi:hypothetical protein
VTVDINAKILTDLHTFGISGYVDVAYMRNYMMVKMNSVQILADMHIFSTSE